ncbi:hypothetical protein LLS1_29940 [Leifsonia sp. LS1]|nr:hypothetical protein LLS1_29940 [Leifsonia sp. LS1]
MLGTHDWKVMVTGPSDEPEVLDEQAANGTAAAATATTASARPHRDRAVDQDM